MMNLPSSFSPPSIAPLTWGRACHTNWPAPERVLGPLQPGDLALISGADGLGKSWVAMAAALSVAKGRNVLGGMWDVPPNTSHALLVAIEDRRADHGSRMQKIARVAQMLGELPQPNQDDDGVTVWPMQGQRLTLVQPAQSREATERYEVTQLGRWFAEQIAQYRLVVLDPLRAFHNLDESDGAGLDFFARWLVSVAMKNEQVILAVHHASQSAILQGREDHHAGRGATDLPAACRAVWTLRGLSMNEAEGRDIADRRAWRVLVNGKASHGAESDNIHLKKDMGGVLVRMELPEKAEKKQGTAPTSRGNAYLASRDGVAISGGDDDEDY